MPVDPRTGRKRTAAGRRLARAWSNGQDTRRREEVPRHGLVRKKKSLLDQAQEYVDARPPAGRVGRRDDARRRRGLRARTPRARRSPTPRTRPARRSPTPRRKAGPALRRGAADAATGRTRGRRRRRAGRERPRPRPRRPPTRRSPQLRGEEPRRRRAASSRSSRCSPRSPARSAFVAKKLQGGERERQLAVVLRPDARAGAPRRRAAADRRRRRAAPRPTRRSPTRPTSRTR